MAAKWQLSKGVLFFVFSIKMILLGFKWMTFIETRVLGGSRKERKGAAIFLFFLLFFFWEEP